MSKICEKYAPPLGVSGPSDCDVTVTSQSGSNKTGPISIINTFDISGIIRLMCIYNFYYLIGLGFVLEAQIPENVVDQMKEPLVNHWNLLDNSSLGRVPATKEGTQNSCTSSIKQTLTSRFEHPVMRPGSFHRLDEKGQAEVFLHKGTNRLIQDKESEKPITTTTHVIRK